MICLAVNFAKWLDSDCGYSNFQIPSIFGDVVW